MRQEYVWLFIGMMLVTFIPRVLPFYLYEKLRIPPWVERPLAMLPCVAIGVFLCPGGIRLYPETPYVAPVALVMSAVVTWLSDSVPLGVLSSVMMAFVLMSV